MTDHHDILSGSSEDTEEHPFRVAFTRCSHGWIDFVLTSRQSSVTISATYLADPFPEMIKWLEQVVMASPYSKWSIDNEGRFIDIEYTMPNGSQGHLVAMDRFESRFYPPRNLSVDIKPCQLVLAFYQSFLSFVQSPLYDSTAWYTPDGSHGTDLEILYSTLIEEWLIQSGDC
jgi:hypothetical protein